MAYPATTWAKVKADYSTGNYSFPQLADKWKISEQAIRNKFVAKGLKGTLKPQIEKTIQERLVAALAKKGVNEKKVSGVISEMMDAEQVKIIPSGKEGQSGFADTCPDWKARNEGVKRYFDIAGIPSKQNSTDAPPALPTRIEVVIINANNQQ